MSGRCKSCNEAVDRFVSFLLDGVRIEEELCNTCRNGSFDTYSYSDREYDHQEITDVLNEVSPSGVTPPKNVDY